MVFIAKNRNLAAAKKTKNDEFYTKISDIEKELVHYEDQLRGKIVFCNCDNPEQSNFWRYFDLNFDHIGIKALISTHYDPEKPTYKLEIRRNVNGDKMDPVKTVLKQNGDFRSAECIDLLKECDVVVTNPPFSMAQIYIALLVEYGKKFIVISNMNSGICKEIFPLLKDDRMWIGYTYPKQFLQPDGTVKSFGNILWYTNIDIKKRHEPLLLSRRYSDDPGKYYRYDNYDAINVDKVRDIPVDYEGMMGVPITFLNKYCPEQFEILGMGCGWNGNSSMILRKYSGVQHQIHKDGSTSVVRKLNDGTPLIKLEKPLTGITCYEVDGYYYFRTYGRVLIRRR